MALAVGQTVTGTASAIPVIRATNGEPDWDQLAKIINQWLPNAFVVGMPYNMDGSENDMTVKATQFIARLEERFDLPCHTMDERLSTREAKDLSRANAERGGKKFNDKAIVDSYAAQLILESWLAENSNKP